MNAQLGNMFYVVFFALAGLAFLVVFFWIFKTEKRLKKFFMGKKTKDLEDVVLELKETIEKLSKANDGLSKEVTVIQAKLKKSVRGLETIRFNPFPDQGGNQSFAISMMNEEGDGLVLSSLYSRERMSVFAKPVKAGKSEYELTEEEAEALNRAKI